MQVAFSGGEKGVQECEPGEEVTVTYSGVLTFEGMSQFSGRSSAVLFQSSSFKCLPYW